MARQVLVSVVSQLVTTPLSYLLAWIQSTFILPPLKSKAFEKYLARGGSSRPFNNKVAPAPPISDAERDLTLRRRAALQHAKPPAPRIFTRPDGSHVRQPRPAKSREEREGPVQKGFGDPGRGKRKVVGYLPPSPKPFSALVHRPEGAHPALDPPVDAGLPPPASPVTEQTQTTQVVVEAGPGFAAPTPGMGSQDAVTPAPATTDAALTTQIGAMGEGPTASVGSTGSTPAMPEANGPVATDAITALPPLTAKEDNPGSSGAGLAVLPESAEAAPAPLQTGPTMTGATTALPAGATSNADAPTPIADTVPSGTDPSLLSTTPEGVADARGASTTPSLAASGDVSTSAALPAENQIIPVASPVSAVTYEMGTEDHDGDDRSASTPSTTATLKNMGTSFRLRAAQDEQVRQAEEKEGFTR